MTRCRNCGRELDGRFKFCDKCGSELLHFNSCPICGNEINQGFEYCPNCGTNLYTDEWEQESGVEVISKAPKGIPPKIFAVIILFFFILAGSCCGFLLLRYLYSESRANTSNYVAYMKEDGLYIRRWDQNESIKLSEKDLDYDIARYVVKSKDGQKIFFPQEFSEDGTAYTLYCKNLNKKKADAQKIDSDITAYLVNDAASALIYIKDDGSIHSYDVKKSENDEIGEHVIKIEASKDLGKLYFQNQDEVLYYWCADVGKTKIDVDVTDIVHFSSDFETIYYLKYDRLYQWKAGEGRERIDTEINSIIKSYDTGEIYYIKEGEEEVVQSRARDIVIDDMPEEYEYRGLVEYWLKRRIFEKNEVVSLYFYDGEEKKMLSDRVVYEESAEELGIICAFDQPEILYFTYASDPKDVEQMTLSKLIEAIKDEDGVPRQDGIPICRDIVCRSMQAHLVKGGIVEECKVNLDSVEELCSFAFDEAGDRLSYVKNYDEHEETGDLYIAELAENEKLKFYLYDENVFYEGIATPGREGCVTYLYGDSYVVCLKNKEVNEEWDMSFDCYVNGEYVDSNVGGMLYNREIDALLYWTDYDVRDQSVTLKVFNGFEKTVIAENCLDWEYECPLISGTEIFYTSNYSSKYDTRDLWVYHDGESVSLDEDISYMEDDYFRQYFYRKQYPGGLWKYGWSYDWYWNAMDIDVRGEETDWRYIDNAIETVAAIVSEREIYDSLEDETNIPFDLWADAGWDSANTDWDLIKRITNEVPCPHLVSRKYRGQDLSIDIVIDVEHEGQFEIHCYCGGKIIERTYTVENISEDQGITPDNAERRAAVKERLVEERERAAVANASVGEYVTFGHYEQNNKIEDGIEPIEWLVLAKEDGRTLVISRYCLDVQPYNAEYAEVTWEDCTLRGWLNDEFFRQAFDVTEQDRIAVITNENPDSYAFYAGHYAAYENDYVNQNYGNIVWGANGGKATYDRVFLLNYEEALEYFDSDEDRICIATAYAGAKGQENLSYEACCWWLRSPGYFQNNAMYVDYYGGELNRDHISARGVMDGGAGVIEKFAVRPAIWITD